MHIPREPLHKGPPQSVQQGPLDGQLFGQCDGFDDHGVGGNAKGGHGSTGGGWYINHKVPFSSSIRVTLELPGVGPPADPEDRLRGAASTFVIVRGTENLPVMVGTITLPRNARLELEKIEDKTFKPGEYVPIVNRDKGHGLIYMTAIQANSTNSDFIQGCCARAHNFAPSLYLSRSMVGSPPRLY
jgi:hypothetical protein